MTFRNQITKANPVGEWFRNYRRKHDMSVSELEGVFRTVDLVGIPLARLETTTSGITRVVSQPLIEYFNDDEELVEAFKQHNHQALSEKYEL